MVDSTILEIADVSFTTRYPDFLSLHEFPLAYQPFLKRGDDVTGGNAIDIVLTVNDMPDTSRMTRIFDTEESWTMFLDDGEYFMSLSPPWIDKRVVWLAHFDRSFRKARIYCGDMLLRKSDDGVTKLLNPFAYPFDQVFLMYVLSRLGGALFHASGIVLRGKGYLFAGKSGAGKSTLTAQFVSKPSNELLSDDRIVVRKSGDAFRAFGTPWHGQAAVVLNRSVPLAGIFFISHGRDNRIRPLDRKEALAKLLPVTSIPWYDHVVMPDILGFCDDLISHIPAFELHFRPDGDVAHLLEEFAWR